MTLSQEMPATCSVTSEQARWHGSQLWKETQKKEGWQEVELDKEEEVNHQELAANTKNSARM